MKIKQILPALLVAALTAGMGCSKKSDDAAPTVKDCEKSNYGTLTVTYGSSTVRHSVLVTLNNSGRSREKISAIGVNSDTLHLHPGMYPVAIASLNAQNQAITSSTRTVGTTQCGDVAASVAY